MPLRIEQNFPVPGCLDLGGVVGVMAAVERPAHVEVAALEPPHAHTSLKSRTHSVSDPDPAGSFYLANWYNWYLTN